MMLSPMITAAVAPSATTGDHWLYVAAPFLLYLATVVGLVLAGPGGRGTDIVSVLCHPISGSLRRLTGYPGWSMAGVLTGLFLLGVGVVGLYWDVAYHIDFGRDEVLFTPSHTMIVLALGGLIVTAGVTVLFATLERDPSVPLIAGLRVPRSAVALGVLGLCGLLAFPLDDVWHRAFGLDITLWSPTHLMLVGAGGLATVPLWLMMVEARAGAEPTLLGRGIEALALGAILTGVSTFQGEFDFGVPQFQILYYPVLAALAAGFALVLARLALGPGGTLKALAAYLVIRGVVALVVGGALGHTVPRFPLYLAAALAVEATAWWLGTEHRLRFAVVAGALVGIVGVGGEIALVIALGWFHLSPGFLPKAMVLAPVAGGAAAVLAAGLGRVVAGGRQVGAGALAAGGVALLAVLAIPLPRNVGEVEAFIRLDPVGKSANVEVELQPPDAAEGATAFGLVSWQGGGRMLSELRQVGPGRYVSSAPVPITGTWKTMVGLQRGNEVMAAPIYLPADVEIGASAVPALTERRTPFVRNTEVLLREAHDGPAWPAIVAYSSLAAMAAVWVTLFAWCARGAARRPDRPAGKPPVAPRTTQPATPRPATWAT
ncbi:MAG: hypothetical protein KY450_04735 [Actinobacteria bacterium]|nr:hypothetical protein [Actinomycetota bacterium]